MIFAIYYTKVGKPFIDFILQTYPHREDDMVERFPEDVNTQIDLCFKSIKRLHPDARLVLLTDQSTPHDLSEDIQIIRYDLDPNLPAYMRLKAQMKFLETTETDEPIIFCDYDILYQNPMTPLFEKEFDIGLVYRKLFNGVLHHSPINGGLMVIKNRIKGLDFLNKVHALYLEKFPDHKAWGGFQVSLNRVLNPKKVHEAFPNTMKVNDTTILLLPSKDYNYAITGDFLFYEFKPEKTIIHFKGPAKQDMIDYWNSYLA